LGFNDDGMSYQMIDINLSNLNIVITQKITLPGVLTCRKTKVQKFSKLKQLAWLCPDMAKPAPIKLMN